MIKITVPQEFRCQLTGEIMENPVKAKDGCRYELKYITGYFSVHGPRSPMTGEPIDSTLEHSCALKKQIKEFQEDHADVCTREEFLEIASLGTPKNLANISYFDTYLDITDINGRTPLHCAACTGNIFFVKSLLNENKNLNLQTRDITNQQTALHCASYSGYENIVELLLKHGANINTKDNEGDTPLHLAALRNHAKIVKKLTEHHDQIDLEATNQMGKTPLMSAICAKHEEMAILLLQSGANIHMTDHRGKTVLHHAAANNTKNLNLLELMINNIKPDTGDNEDNTPLHEAVRHHCIPMIKFLLHHQASLTCENKAGEIPADLTLDPILEKSLRDPKTKESPETLEHTLTTSQHITRTPLKAAIKQKEEELALLKKELKGKIKTQKNHTYFFTQDLKSPKPKKNYCCNPFTLLAKKMSHKESIAEIQLLPVQKNNGLS